ncbi:Spy/CpxP family protein refolding chaperone [Phenylobacterium sp.]|uniref:Spy/CpxP family protein refolding chaperone n=1 Tax=Phenylobacterium sp. TaxID=1871053 RepID=UPI002DF2DADA|nr:Spy/CpxP family protein refolding chaperone [Phenylobacterium sp.]
MRTLVLGCCLALWAPGALAAEQAVSADLLRLHDDLHLSEAQEAGWRNYTLAIAPDPQVEARHRAAAELLPAVPTPRRIALMQATMDTDAVDFRRHAAAVIAFYGQLTPSQQRTFDLETAPQGASERTAAPSSYPRP